MGLRKEIAAIPRRYLGLRGAANQSVGAFQPIWPGDPDDRHHHGRIFYLKDLADDCLDDGARVSVLRAAPADYRRGRLAD